MLLGKRPKTKATIATPAWSLGRIWLGRDTIRSNVVRSLEMLLPSLLTRWNQAIR